MGSHCEWKCSSCGYAVWTHGLLEFYRDAAGVRKPYGHPVPASEEAERRGIWGFFSIGYCPSCDMTEDVILFELETPWKKRGSRPAKRKYELNHEPRCSNCGGRLYEALPEGEITCPRCNKGVFQVARSLQS